MENNDFCWITSQVNNIPYINFGKKFYNEKFPNLPSQCPIEPGKYYANNVTVIEGNDADLVVGFDILSPGAIPNGVYRHIVKLATKTDPIGLMLYWHTEIHDPMGQFNFWWRFHSYCATRKLKINQKSNFKWFDRRGIWGIWYFSFFIAANMQR